MIFKKKTALKDLLNGATDIHNHILPGIDDGAQNIKESIELIKKYQSLGISQIYATPHIMTDYYPNTPNTINTALESLTSQLLKNNISDIKIKAASEYMIDAEFEELITNNMPLLTLKDNHILVEMSYLRASQNIKEVLYKLQLKGYTPILAHPERYLYYSNDINIFNTFKDTGVKLQLNALSLTEHYGSKITKVAYKLLKLNLYDFFGTDTHKLSHLDKVETIKIKSDYKDTIIAIIENNKALF